jgi:hypothetical protein
MICPHLVPKPCPERSRRISLGTRWEKLFNPRPQGDIYRPFLFLTRDIFGTPKGRASCRMNLFTDRFTVDLRWNYGEVLFYIVSYQ